MGIARSALTKNRNTIAATAPMRAARISDARMPPAIAIGASVPWPTALMNAIATMMLSTSVSADSRMSTVAGTVPIGNCLTIGITTADDVPPSMAPMAHANSHGRPTPKCATPATITIVAMNVSSVTIDVALIDCVSARSSSDIPLSKRMTTSATLLITPPTLPKSSTLMKPKTGPARMPSRISDSTSGTCVRRKTAVNRLAENNTMPRARTAVAMAADCNAS